MKALKNICAVLGGLLSGGLLVALIEGISSFVYKMPEGLDFNDKTALGDWVSGLPFGAFLFLLVAWVYGVFVGVFIARRIAPNRSMIPGLIVWAFFTLATIYNLFSLPHPTWLWFAGILACLAFGLLGLVLAGPKSFVVACTRTINAPIEKVFKTLASIDQFSKAVPHITKVEFLTDSHYGVGTKFRETRLMNGKENAVELEVTELVENEHVRITSEAGGTLWDTRFRVKPSGEAVEMKMQMDCIPHNFFAKALTPLIIPMIAKFVEADMDSVKAFCEEAN